MAGVGGLQVVDESAAVYYLVVPQACIQDGHVVLSGEWIALKSTPYWALDRFMRHECSSRAEVSSKISGLVAYKFTLTLAGQGAVFLGHWGFEQRLWERDSIRLTWRSRAARYRGNLPLFLNASGVQLWISEQVSLPTPEGILNQYDAGAGAAQGSGQEAPASMDIEGRGAKRWRA